MHSLIAPWITGSRHRRGGFPATVAAAAVALLIGGCAADRQGTLSVAGPLPPSAPKVTGVERAASREHARLVAAFGGEYHAPAVEAMLDNILARVVPASGDPQQTYKITILNSSAVNAFALPTGNIYVTRGLLVLANDSSEVAAVLAHEIGHVTANHAMARAELEQRSILVGRVVAEVLNDPNAGKMVRNESRLSLAGFSRAQELEADRIGIKTIAKAGFDPAGAARFLVSLQRNTDLRTSGASRGESRNDMDIASSHPSTPERITQALVAARSLGGQLSNDFDRSRYLAAIDGVVYGEDPTEGYVRGRRFVHPALAIAFAAPEGFSMENTFQAVLGIGPGGGQAFRFDGVQVPADEPLETFLASGSVEGLDSGSMEVTTVNGMPALTATAKGKEWTFRIGAIRSEATVYRLLFATRSPGPESERAFRETLSSIRRLTPDEARAVKPWRVTVVSAREGDTAEKFAARMAATDQALERFLVLNGLDRGAPLRPGHRYKVITEG